LVVSKLILTYMFALKYQLHSTGTIPTTLGACTKLQFLGLGTNSLVGEHSTRTLVNIERACFSYSHHHYLSRFIFAGTIPALSTLTNLQFLSLDTNLLFGEHLPKTLVHTRAIIFFVLTSPTLLFSCVHRHDSCI